MAHSYEGTTLALQHYYDIIGTPKTQPLMTIYPANEQPFGHRMSVWMATYNGNNKLSEATTRRLDEAMLKNRAISDPHVLRVLDYGTSEGNSFVVTDAMNSITLRAYLRAHGQLQTWQALRLLEQLTGIITSAHKANFSNLCLTSDNIFIRDEERFEIQTGPLGIGLHRAEILKLRDVTITAEMMRHLPPWEFNLKPVSVSDNAQNQASEPTKVQKDNQSDKSEDKTDKTQPREDNVTSDTTTEHTSEPESEHHSHDDSIQDLDPSTASIECNLDIPEPPENACPDVYALAAILYESLCGQHPYFSETGDLCDAALSIIQANPPELSKRIEIDDKLSAVVMETLLNPIKDSAPQLLANFAALCSETDREKSREAEKNWLKPTQTSAPGKRPKRMSPQLKHPFIWLGMIAAVLIVLSVSVTWKIAQHFEPVDLFALPELLPMAQHDGVDVVIAPRTAAPNTSIYLVSLADGRPIRLGTLPYIYRNQEDGAKLNFLISDDNGNNMQVPVTVKGEQGMMFVPIEINW